MTRSKILLLSNRTQAEAIASWWWLKAPQEPYNKIFLLSTLELRYGGEIAPRVRAFRDMVHQIRSTDNER